MQKMCKDCTTNVKERCKASKHAYMDETSTRSWQEMCSKIATIVKKRTKSVQKINGHARRMQHMYKNCEGFVQKCKITKREWPNIFYTGYPIVFWCIAGDARFATEHSLSLRAKNDACKTKTENLQGRSWMMTKEFLSNDEKSKLCSPQVSIKLNWFFLDHGLRPAQDIRLRTSSPIVLWSRLRLGSIAVACPLTRRRWTTREKVPLGGLALSKSGQQNFGFELSNEVSKTTHYLCGLSGAVYKGMSLFNSSHLLIRAGLLVTTWHTMVPMGTKMCWRELRSALFIQELMVALNALSPMIG